MASPINNKMQRGPLHPHMWMKKALPLFRICCSSGWTVLVVKIVVGSTSMIFLLPLFLELDSKSGFSSLSLISATNDVFERHSSVLCQGILWNSHHFSLSFFVFPWPFFSYGLDWFLGDYLLELSLLYFGCCGFIDPKSRLFWCLNFCSILTTYR